MIKGAWDVITHIHPVDGSFRFKLAAERFVSNENSLLRESRSILPPQGVSEEVAVDVGEHTPTKIF